MIAASVPLYLNAPDKIASSTIYTNPKEHESDQFTSIFFLLRHRKILTTSWELPATDFSVNRLKFLNNANDN
jgi:hypothetical protein